MCFEYIFIFYLNFYIKCTIINLLELKYYVMNSIEELVKNELNDLFFSYSYSEVSISDKNKEQIVNSVIYNIQRITGSPVSKETINKINSILDVQVVNMQCSKF